MKLVGSRPRISFFVHDLATNPVARAAPIAEALESDYEIEVLGLLVSGNAVWAPYRGKYLYRTVSSPPNTVSVLQAVRLLSRMATGDVIYAFKPLLTSFAPALMASRRRGAPLILDADDDEWIPFGTSPASVVWRDVIKGWGHPTAWKYTRMLHPLTRMADAVTVSSTKLQARYGGVIVLHGPDASVFDPSRPDLANTAACREQFGLPANRKLALFAGTPRPHKGLPILLAAMQLPVAANWDLVLAGDRQHSDFVAAQCELGSRCHLMGMIENNRLPHLLAVADAVPIPQRRVTFTESQLPTKLLEGMAMSRAVVASAVGDIPEILGNGTRGWLIEPDDATGLAVALRTIADDPGEVYTRAREARRWYLEEASRDAISRKVKPIVAKLLEGKPRSGAAAVV